jgi:hypothetical protein
VQGLEAGAVGVLGNSGGDEVLAREDGIDRRADLGDPVILGDVPVGAPVQRFLHQPAIGVHRDHDDLRRREPLLELGQHFEPALVRHGEIEQDAVRRALAEQIQQLAPGMDHANDLVEGREEVGETAGDELVVVYDDEGTASHRSGPKPERHERRAPTSALSWRRRRPSARDGHLLQFSVRKTLVEVLGGRQDPGLTKIVPLTAPGSLRTFGSHRSAGASDVGFFP